jgi:hypothetical protein
MLIIEDPAVPVKYRIVVKTLFLGLEFTSDA